VLALPDNLKEWADMAYATGAENSIGTGGMEGIRSKGSEMYKEGVVGSVRDETEGDDMQDDDGL
jgi:hypothetical protein